MTALVSANQEEFWKKGPLHGHLQTPSFLDRSYQTSSTIRDAGWVVVASCKMKSAPKAVGNRARAPGTRHVDWSSEHSPFTPPGSNTSANDIDGEWQSRNKSIVHKPKALPALSRRLHKACDPVKRCPSRRLDSAFALSGHFSTLPRYPKALTHPDTRLDGANREQSHHFYRLGPCFIRGKFQPALPPSAKPLMNAS